MPAERSKSVSHAMQLIIVRWGFGYFRPIYKFISALLTDYKYVEHLVLVWTTGNIFLVFTLNTELYKIFDMFMHYLYENHNYVLF